MKKTETRKGTIFQKVFLESLTKTTAPIALSFYGGISALFAFLNVRSNIVVSFKFLLLPAGFAFWTLFEYLMHRYIFHFTSKKKWASRLHYIIHGVHHDFPRDRERLFMPPVPGSLILLCLSVFFYTLLNQYCFGFLSGMVGGYLVYATFHYLIHTRKAPKRFKRLWAHHFQHHHKYPEKAFGVSNTFWDRVFGTLPQQKK